MALQTHLRWFNEIGLGDVAEVGGKTASLGELYTALSPQGIRVPNGFAITAQAYRDALDASGAWGALRQVMIFDHRDVALLSDRAATARRIVYGATENTGLHEQIATAYRRLEQEYGGEVAVAVRSSATAKDPPNASFAGQHESYLNVRGEDDVSEASPRLNRPPLNAGLANSDAIYWRSTRACWKQMEGSSEISPRTCAVTF